MNMGFRNRKRSINYFHIYVCIGNTNVNQYHINDIIGGDYELIKKWTAL